ncbi:hypothetical protein A3Q56_06695 [Intoshia linei]|uniref:Uncharacterized protein n=1 Tax=Intoshia linei TaxID=1819745 RepID=A0A177AUA5_9BILA|nr:hypothetical protein A3Q56_06695 [Intoshia linei]
MKKRLEKSIEDNKINNLKNLKELKSIHMNKIKKLKKKLIEDNIIEFEIKWKNMYEKDKQNFNNEIKEMSYLKQRSRLKSFKLKFNKDKILSKDTFLISAEQKNLIKLAELEKNCIKDYYSSEIEFMNEEENPISKK